ncbi:MAG: helix-turn-helix domain-containing protein, partial [Oscillospiraceae bacterium]
SLLPYLLDSGFYRTDENYGHFMYKLDPNIGHGSYRVFLLKGKFLVTLKDFSYNRRVEMLFGAADYLHADCPVLEKDNLLGYIGNSNEYKYVLSPSDQIKGIGICIMPEFCREIMGRMPGISYESLCAAFCMLSKPNPFPKGAAIMRQLKYAPVSKTSALYYEAKVKEFIAVLLDWYEQLQCDTNNGIVYPEDRQAVGRVAKHIEGNFAKQLDMAGCLKTACMGKSKLSVIFRQVTGLIMSAYLTNICIENAKYLLSDSGKTIQQISSLVGYQNHSSFAASFKICTGYSPKEYRAIYYQKTGME